MSDVPVRPFRFGVQLSGPADAAGLGRAGPPHRGPRLLDGHDARPLHRPAGADAGALPAAAAATTTLRVGALVFDNDYKHPVVLAKELATMDVLSDGRVEIGLGAGWMESDYRAAGIALRPARRAHRPLRGGARRCIKGAMADGPFSFAGQHYTITDYDGQPKPVQRPHPPILIGGGGRRVLVDRRPRGRHRRHQRQPGGRRDRPGGRRDDDARGRRRAAWRIVRDAAGDADRRHRAEHPGLLRQRHRRPRRRSCASVAGIIGVERDDDRDVAVRPHRQRRRRSSRSCVRRREELGFSYVIVGGDDIEPSPRRRPAAPGTLSVDSDGSELAVLLDDGDARRR